MVGFTSTAAMTEPPIPSVPPSIPLPSPGGLVRRIVLHLSEAILIPLGLFYAVNALVGLWPALAASAGWAVLAIATHLIRGGRPSALLVLTGALAALQIGLTAAARSPVVFFLQPTLATYAFAVAMLVTARRTVPVILRLALDFVPLPPVLLASRPVSRFFRRLSYGWAGVLGANATITLVLLLVFSTTLAVPLATAASIPAFLLGLGLSYRGFGRAIATAGYTLGWGSV